MAETQADVLKQFVKKVTTSSVNERISLLSLLHPLLERDDLPEQTQKGILKQLLFTLELYQDAKSRRAAEKVIQILTEKHFDQFVKVLNLVLGDHIEIYRKGRPSRGSGAALNALSWTCLVVHHGFKNAEAMQGNHFNKLVEVQSLLVYGACAARTSILEGIYNRLKRIWKEREGSLDCYVASVQKLEAGAYLMCMIGCIMKFLTNTKNHEAIQKYKSGFLEVYVKHVLGSRSKPPVQILTSCKALLRHVDHDQFKVAVIPAMEKAMLRNPEIVIEVVCEMLDGLSIDLSPYVLEVGKHLATQSHSKEEEFRLLAAKGWSYLAQQCSDSAAVEKIVKHLFAVFNGSEGKLTIAAQRLGMLSAVGNMSHNTVAGANTVQGLSATVVEYFIPVLQQEVHEGTLVHALNQLQPWCLKFSTQVPEKLVQWFKTGMGQKSSNATVRNGYIQCMLAAFQRDTISQGVPLLPVLLQAVEKASAQPNQYQVVTEALSATLLLTKLSQADISAEGKLTNFWNIILDPDRQLFLNEKFLAAASDDALQTLATLTERLLLEHPQRMTDKISKPYYKAMVRVLVQGSHKVRARGRAALRRIYNAPGGATLALSFLQQFSVMVQDPSLVLSDDSDDKEGEESASSSSKAVLSRHLAESISKLAAIPDPENEVDLARSIAMEAIYTSHHPSIAQTAPDCWVDLLWQLKLEPATFMQEQLPNFMSQLTNLSSVEQSHKNTLSTLVRIIPDQVLPYVMEQVDNSLSNSALLTVTHEEYFIMHTPDGELYDKAILQQGAEDTKIANVKRESKLYSYADQLDDLKFRQEMERKKKAQSGNSKDEPKLSKKQIEMKQAQLQKEADIRAKLLKLDAAVKKVCDMLMACISGNPVQLSSHIPQLLKYILPLLRSPLTAPRVVDIYLALRAAVFTDQDQFFQLVVVFATLRVLSPECDLDATWCEEPSRKMVTRALLLLHGHTVPPEGLKKANVREPFSAPTFSYVFPLLRAILQSHGSVTEGQQATLVKAMQVILVHCEIRSKLNDKLDENGPELLPREAMFKLFTYLVGTNTGRIQQMASQAILTLAESANGEEGCTTAQYPEIVVLMEALQAPAAAVREVALQALHELSEVLPMVDEQYQEGLQLAHRIWISEHDQETEIAKTADSLWIDCGMDLCPELCTLVVQDIVHQEAVVRDAAARAVAAAVKEQRDFIHLVLQQLMELYQEKLYMPPPVLDAFGRVVSESPPDEAPARCGIAMALEELSPYFPQDEIKPMFAFFVEKSLGDRDEEVRKKMVVAAVAAINEHGKNNITSLLPVFEKFLAEAPDSAKYDAVRQSVVILMGSLAKHLDKNDPKVKPIVAKLIETLSTPSQPVQEAVANCLPPLVPAIKSDAPNLVKKLLMLLLESESYGERRGAAYGLAGLVKGLGILALKQQDIMTKLTDAIQNKKKPRYREGALFAIEMLCMMLGRLFEPYVVHILPHLLLCFGDSNAFVRVAADDTAKAVMSKLSAHGVKLILPSLLSALEEDAWRTKTGSAELLGAMAFCAPKQLSACLPSIVPKLIEVLTDSHIKVQKATAQALKQIGSVIRNPEIQAIVPNLLEALQDPSRKTTSCLQCLLDTKFVHFIDAPSLALIMPVVQRSFQDRSTETRKMAAQIIGNMYSLTDQKDLSPYLPAVIPGLKQSLLDPVPEVRMVSARALGAMVKGMGESGFEELLPWLMETLTSEGSSVDRSGAAQGLSEVVGGLGLAKLSKLMPDIIQTAERVDIPPHIRDGYIMMFIYLPGVFGDDFIPYVGPSIPSILQALADESEFVRDTALKAGQRVVNLYADTAIELLLPELERGLFADNWRIRYASVQLLGDLLYKLSGVSGKMSTETADEDDNFGTESSQHLIMRALGTETRNRILSGLYMGRSDTALMVRQSALHVWKIIVAHTPKTLREILSTLFELLLGCLASKNYDKRQVAARTLGDIVRKLGEKVLPEIIPILERGLESDQCDQRQGVCIGLSEIMASTSRDHVIVFADSLIPTVRKALCDPLPEVREAAANTFVNLHANIGPRTLDDILPNLLHQLEDDSVSEYALDGLKQVMAVKSRVVLPYLVPQLTSPPVNTRALAFLSSVAGESLNKHLSRILPALISSLSEKIGAEDEQEEVQHCQSVILSVMDDAGIRIVIDELLSFTNHEKSAYRCAAVLVLQAHCEQSKTDNSEHVPSLFRGLIRLFTDSDERVLLASWECLNAITKKLDASDMLQHISTVRQAVRYAVSDHKGMELPGFCLPKKGIAPILPIFREGILNGPAELKESAAVGLGEVIKLTSADALKPSVVNITGPLIRILGERFLFNVKVAVLQTLGLLLSKCGAMLRPFLPQLQTTFVKALNDPNRMVRLKAAAALGGLVSIHPRVDPLFTELHNGVKSADESSVRDTMIQALRGCIVGAGAKMSIKIRKDITQTLEAYLSNPDDSTRTTSAACLGCLCAHMTDEELTHVVGEQFLDTDTSIDWVIRHGRSVGLFIALKVCPDKLNGESLKTKVSTASVNYTKADRVPICLSGLRAVGYSIQYQLQHGESPSPEYLQAINKCMKQESNDVKALAAQVVGFIAKSSETPLEPAVARTLVPMLVNGTKEKNTLVKTNSECGLVAVLRLRQGDDTYKSISATLEHGMRDSLTDVVNKVLKKCILQPDTEENIDDTMLV